MHVNAQRDRCIGSGQCVMTAPTVFDQDNDDGLVLVIKEALDEDEQEQVLAAVSGCPVQAIAAQV
jgi:ferredoxin